MIAYDTLKVSLIFPSQTENCKLCLCLFSAALRTFYVNDVFEYNCNYYYYSEQCVMNNRRPCFNNDFHTEIELIIQVFPCVRLVWTLSFVYSFRIR